MMEGEGTPQSFFDFNSPSPQCVMDALYYDLMEEARLDLTNVSSRISSSHLFLEVSPSLYTTYRGHSHPQQWKSSPLPLLGQAQSLIEKLIPSPPSIKEPQIESDPACCSYRYYIHRKGLFLCPAAIMTSKERLATKIHIKVPRILSRAALHFATFFCPPSQRLVYYR